MIDSSNHRHACPGLSTIRRELRSGMVSARAEQLRGGSLSLEKGFAEPFGEGSHRLHRADEIAEAAFLVPVDEFDVGRRPGASAMANEKKQPSSRNRRQVISGISTSRRDRPICVRIDRTLRIRFTWQRLLLHVASLPSAYRGPGYRLPAIPGRRTCATGVFQGSVRCNGSSTNLLLE